MTSGQVGRARPATVLSFSPDSGLAGAERALLALATGLRGHGIDFRVVCAAPGGLADHLTDAGFTVFQAPAWPAKSRRRRSPIRFLRWRLAQVAAVTRAIVACQPEVIHVNAAGGALATVVARRRVAPSVPVVVHLRHLCRDRLACLGFASVDRIIAVSEAARSALPAVWRQRAVVVYDGVRLPAAAVERRPSASEPSLLIAARVAPDKGHDILLDAVARLAARGLRLRLTMALEASPDRAVAAYRRRVLDRAATLAGVITVPWTDDVSSLLAGHDVVVVPSRREALGMVAVEAMAVGTPVVASRVGGLQETVVHEVSGLLVEPGDPVALAAALERLLGNPELWLNLSRGGVERSRRFTTEATTTGVLGELETVRLRGRRRSSP